MSMLQLVYQWMSGKYPIWLFLMVWHWMDVEKVLVFKNFADKYKYKW